MAYLNITDMEQMTDYTNNLLPYLPPSRLLTLSCSHVIPPTNLLALPVSIGPGGIPFDFTFAQRSNEGMIRELGTALIELCEIVPDGLVVFFPSYGYLDSVLNVWKKKQQMHGKGTEIETTSIWQQLERRKKVFLEPKSSASGATTASTSTTDSAPRDINTPNQTNTTNKLDALLQAYSSHIHSRPTPHHQNQPTIPHTHQPDGYNGALLLAVINGSLSEGINFSDRLGRCVVVVGLPFPNASSAAWKAKLEYVGNRAVAANEASTVSRVSTGSPTTSSDTTATNPPITSSGQPAPIAPSTSPTTTKTAQALSSAASRAHYTNACMRAVNQSIGRAIRHANDYGTILLFDSRWERKEGGRGEELRGLLPGWIRESLVVDGGKDGGGRGGKWEGVKGRIEGFFERKRG